MKRSMLYAAPLLLCIAIAAQTAPQPSGSPVIYKHAGDRPLSLYVTQPRDDVKVHPAILFFHGGGWTEGSPAAFNFQAAAVASHGIVGITVEYRLLDKDGTEPPRICVEDARSAMRWVRAHAAELHVDPRRIAAAGGSAGGYMAAYLAAGSGWTDPSDDQAVSARPDALLLFNPVLDNSPQGFGNKRFGSEAALRSPLNHVSRDLPPMLIQSGSDDRLIPADVLRAYQNAVRANNVECDVVIYDGQVHAFFNKKPFLTDTTDTMLKFLRHLGWTVDDLSAGRQPLDR